MGTDFMYMIRYLLTAVWFRQVAAVRKLVQNWGMGMKRREVETNGNEKERGGNEWE